MNYTVMKTHDKKSLDLRIFMVSASFSLKNPVVHIQCEVD